MTILWPKIEQNIWEQLSSETHTDTNTWNKGRISWPKNMYSAFRGPGISVKTSIQTFLTMWNRIPVPWNIQPLVSSFRTTYKILVNFQWYLSTISSCGKFSAGSQILNQIFVHLYFKENSSILTLQFANHDFHANL